MDPSSRLWLIIGYILLLAGSAFFSAAENALAAANKIRLRAWAEDGKKRATLALSLIDRFDRTLTTILIGNNICNVAGVSVATVFIFGILRDALNSGKIAEGTVTFLITLVTTVVTFLFAEMTPKSLALANADKFVMALAPAIRFISVVLYPLCFFFGGISKLANLLFGGEDSPTVTEEELSLYIDTVEQEGSIDEEQSDLLQSALEFSDTTVADILTIREDIVAIEANMPDRLIMETIRESGYSRIPVYDGDLDHIVGILHAKNYMKARIRREGLSLTRLCSPVTYTTLDRVIDDLLEDMSQSKTTMAIVRDDEGNTIGLVTVEDFLEELVGEIYDEDDVVNDHFTKLGGKYFRVSATYTIGEMFRDMSYRGKVNMSRVKSVASWVTESLGHTPEEEDTFVWRDLTVTVTDIDENGKLEYIEVKLADPVLDSVVAEGSEEEVEAE